MKGHHLLVHEGMKYVKCNICDANFAQKAHLNGHMASVHEGKTPFKCSIYDASFAEKRELIGL